MRWDSLSPGWFLQWGVDNMAKKHPNMTIEVIDENGKPLCGLVPPNPKGKIFLIADNSKIYR